MHSLTNPRWDVTLMRFEWTLLYFFLSVSSKVLSSASSVSVAGWRMSSSESSMGVSAGGVSAGWRVDI